MGSEASFKVIWWIHQQIYRNKFRSAGIFQRTYKINYDSRSKVIKIHIVFNDERSLTWIVLVIFMSWNFRNYNTSAGDLGQGRVSDDRLLVEHLTFVDHYLSFPILQHIKIITILWVVFLLASFAIFIGKKISQILLYPPINKMFCLSLVFNFSKFKYLNTKKGSQTCGVKINRETKRLLCRFARQANSRDFFSIWFIFVTLQGFRLLCFGPDISPKKA